MARRKKKIIYEGWTKVRLFKYDNDMDGPIHLEATIEDAKGFAQENNNGKVKRRCARSRA